MKGIWQRVIIKKTVGMGPLICTTVGIRGNLTIIYINGCNKSVTSSVPEHIEGNNPIGETTACKAIRCVVMNPSGTGWSSDASQVMWEEHITGKVICRLGVFLPLDLGRGSA